jgi:type III restriction enzyme
MTGEQPTYRDLWLRIRDDLPKKGRKTDEVEGEPKLPVELELQGALLNLYGNYGKYYRLWEQNGEARARGITSPVFIVVCNNTNVSKLVFEFIAGWVMRLVSFRWPRSPDAMGCWAPGVHTAGICWVRDY